MKAGWCLLKNLRPGAVFVTADGVMAFKTEYSSVVQNFAGRVTGTCPDCYVLASGEMAHFPEKEATPVLEIPVANPAEKSRDRKIPT